VLTAVSVAMESMVSVALDYWTVVVDMPAIAALVRGPKNPVAGSPFAL